ncbi:MAG: hypothetical protein E6J14_15425 [Chloroflexi bacterium]|nr:MAG: hypothetical protein E6J14_15425 [Chloroflexota bacterium]
MSDEPAPRPFPQRDRDTTPFWEAQDKHELRFQRCTGCGSVRYRVTPLCPNCHSFDHEWIASSGRGHVYSYTVVRRQTHPAFPVPYTVALAEMEEGPRVAAQVRGHDGGEIALGAPVHVEWEDHPKQSLPVFVLD